MWPRFATAEPDGLDRASIEADPDQAVRIAMAERIADQVRRHLRESIGVPVAHEVAGRFPLDLPVRVRSRAFVDDAAQRRLEVAPDCRRTAMPAPTRRAARRRSSMLLDHPAHSSRAGQRACRHLSRRIVGGLSLEHHRCHHDGAQRAPEIMAQHRREELGHAQCLGALAQLFGELKLLPEELEEDAHLAPDDVCVDRLLEEIDGAALIALEDPALIGQSGGDEDDRDVARARAATASFRRARSFVHVGHLDVEDRHCDRLDEQQTRAPPARSGRGRIRRPGSSSSAARAIRFSSRSSTIEAVDRVHGFHARPFPPRPTGAGRPASTGARRRPAVAWPADPQSRRSACTQVGLKRRSADAGMTEAAALSGSWITVSAAGALDRAAPPRYRPHWRR